MLEGSEVHAETRTRTIKLFSLIRPIRGPQNVPYDRGRAKKDSSRTSVDRYFNIGAARNGAKKPTEEKDSVSAKTGQTAGAKILSKGRPQVSWMLPFIWGTAKKNTIRGFGEGRSKKLQTSARNVRTSWGKGTPPFRILSSLKGKIVGRSLYSTEGKQGEKIQIAIAMEDSP